jgi:hypothetical protein
VLMVGCRVHGSVDGMGYKVEEQIREKLFNENDVVAFVCEVLRRNWSVPGCCTPTPRVGVGVCVCVCVSVVARKKRSVAKSVG